MANKTVTFTEPVEADLRDIRIRFSPEGAVVRVSGNIVIASDDDSSVHSSSFAWDDIQVVPQGVQTAIDTIKTAAITKFKADNSF